jgi:hypothetical protein
MSELVRTAATQLDVGATHSQLADEERDVLQAVLLGPFVIEQECIPSTVADAAILKAFENGAWDTPHARDLANFDRSASA